MQTLSSCLSRDSLILNKNDKNGDKVVGLGTNSYMLRIGGSSLYTLRLQLFLIYRVLLFLILSKT